MNNPYVVLGIDCDTDGHPDVPVIGKGFGPERVNLEPGCHHYGAFDDSCLVEDALTDKEAGQKYEKNGPNIDVMFFHRNVLNVNRTV
jgi:hypothetical protein